MADVYLASKSPRRRELLEQIGVQYQVLAVEVEEVREPQEQPAAYVQRLSADKAAAGVAKLQAKGMVDQPVLGSDTIVVLDGRVLEKPLGEAEGLAMLQALSGRTHEVMTAVSVHSAAEQRTLLSTTEVRFRDISAEEMARYWQTGEPCDKAGGYGIQGLAAVFVAGLNGSYSGVVGLPLAETQQLLSDFNVPCWQ